MDRNEVSNLLNVIGNNVRKQVALNENSDQYGDTEFLEKFNLCFRNIREAENKLPKSAEMSKLISKYKLNFHMGNDLSSKQFEELREDIIKLAVGERSEQGKGTVLGGNIEKAVQEKAARFNNGRESQKPRGKEEQIISGDGRGRC